MSTPRLGGGQFGGYIIPRGPTSDSGRGTPGLLLKALALAGFFAETALASAPGRVAGITEGGSRFLDNSEALFGIA